MSWKTQKSNSNSNNKFQIAQAKNMTVAQKIIDSYASSTEDEEELDEQLILKSLYKHYDALKEKNKQNDPSTRTATFLENMLHSGAATCLICIGSVRRSDAVWSCKDCYCIFHLNCIKRWANDSLVQLKAQAQEQNANQGHYNHLGEYVPPKKQRAPYWYCPQCRTVYEPNEKPTEYKCYCAKELNPQFQTFLVPHSCGEICDKLLQPSCGHRCKLLCHPGPCPPCAQYANVSCLCGNSLPKIVRCVDKNWQCKKICQKLLPCGEHVCERICHRLGQCPPCNNTSMQACECGREVKMRNCAHLKWKCQKICGKKYSCGVHTCKKVCHADECGECPLGLPRMCPCGKSCKIGPCTQVIDSCGDTCQKLLPCGSHACAQRCHRGACNLCLVITKKSCRCGLHEKELPCSKEFICETKCKQLRDCGKHACNRKCCDGNCPPCEKICGKPLTCNKHKCQSVCHNGPCYPCNQQSQINCRCGKTHKCVPCGTERKTRIVCLELCRVVSKCQHSVTHRCHKGDCPPCNQKCGLTNDTSGCGHVCIARCHTAVRCSVANNVQKKYEYKKLPHPKCEQKVSVTCLGGHEVTEWPCWNSKPTSCQRPCKRQLNCGQHTCEVICHTVPDPRNMNQQTGCAPCEKGCENARSEGCIHPCLRACHPPPCAPCNVNIKTKCHCGLTQVIFKCCEYFKADCSEKELTALQDSLRSCGNRCLKNFPCGHRCTSICHSGNCSNAELCRKKIKIYCACKRLKLEITCDKQRAGQIQLDCDSNCNEARLRLEQDQKRQLEVQKRIEEAKNRLEVEQFEKKFGKRKYKERKVVVEKANSKTNWKLICICAGTLVAFLLAFAVALYADS